MQQVHDHETPILGLECAAPPPKLRKTGKGMVCLECLAYERDRCECGPVRQAVRKRQVPAPRSGEDDEWLRLLSDSHSQYLQWKWTPKPILKGPVSPTDVSEEHDVKPDALVIQDDDDTPTRWTPKELDYVQKMREASEIIQGITWLGFDHRYTYSETDIHEFLDMAGGTCKEFYIGVTTNPRLRFFRS